MTLVTDQNRGKNDQDQSVGDGKVWESHHRQESIRAGLVDIEREQQLSLHHRVLQNNQNPAQPGGKCNHQESDSPLPNLIEKQRAEVIEHEKKGRCRHQTKDQKHLNIA